MTIRRPLALGLVISLAAGLAGCETTPFWRQAGPPTPPQTITDPQWKTRPTAADIQRVYPLDARRNGTSGSVTLNCMVEDEGGLRPCAVTSETPARMGFGEAALKAAPLYQMPTQTAEGRPTRGASVSVTINFAPAPV